LVIKSVVLKNTDCLLLLIGCFQNVSKKNILKNSQKVEKRLSTGELGDGFGTFTDGVFGKFSWEDKTDSGLDFATGKGCFLVVCAKFSGFTGDFTKDVVDEGVHDGHSFFGHTGVWVNLFQDLVDVDRERFDTLLLAFGSCCFFASFLGHF